jgi:hypothetical protein
MLIKCILLRKNSVINVYGEVKLKDYGFKIQICFRKINITLKNN